LLRLTASLLIIRSYIKIKVLLKVTSCSLVMRYQRFWEKADSVFRVEDRGIRTDELHCVTCQSNMILIFTSAMT